ncbi:putative type IX secretion system sortase PorU2 [Flaviaesturariibacter terrae]
MKKVLLGLLMLLGLSAFAQPYYNEWIDYSKTYYKFKVGATGLYRIPQATLQAAGLGAAPAQGFQLWRNGREVPLYTTVTSGTLGASDYIEFWGEMNDGAPDSLLYREHDYQLANRWSLQTDTAVYFLTVNNGPNLRLATTANNVTGTALSPEPYFLYTAGRYFKDQINNGYAVNVGDYMYSSSYDRGEGWTSAYIPTNGSNSSTFSNLFPYTGAAPLPKFVIALSGSATNPRSYRVTINGDSTIGGPVNYFNELTDSTTFPISRLATGNAAVTVFNNTTYSSDRLAIHRYEITYPRQFNFGGASSFEFSLPATATGQYIQVTNFSNGGAAPVLYDLTNGLRLVANTDVNGQFRFVLPPSADSRRLVLVRADGTQVTPVTALQSRTFTDYALAQNAGDYLIITHPSMTQGANGSNPVEEYRAYRASSAGGSYNAKTFYTEDLIDQFAFGIKMHPLGIANFIRYARNRFPTAPQGVFIIGKGVVYNQARVGENNPVVYQLNLVPTWGYPASDNLLTADAGSSQPKTPIGRLSVVWPYEVANYLAKVRQFEAAQQFQSPLIADKAWMKNVVHLAGSTEPALINTLSVYLDQLKQTISDTLFGAKVTTFIKNSPNTIEQINNGELDRLFAEGLSLITYFGHSASSHLEYNLNNPDQYNNPGKYPLFVALGCNVGNVYNLNGTRLNALETISEQYTLAPNRGSIGFIASSHFGITDYLQNLSRPFYANLSAKMYGETIGAIMNRSVADMFSVYTEGDFYARATAEEANLDGDPVLRINPHAKPDYVIEDQLVRVSPGFVSVADNDFHLTAQMINMGRAIDHPVVVEVTRQYPNGSTALVLRDTLPGIRYIDSIGLDIPIDPNRDKGLNRITVTIDPDNEIAEKFETNNSISKDVFIYEDEARPVYPYNYAIVSRQNIRFVASTANPFAATRNYRMELDTTELFNSPLKTTTNLTGPGGVLEFNPAITFLDNQVYYWRVAEITGTSIPNWTKSSFLYKAGSDTGFNQSHYYQHRYSDYERIHLDSASRRFLYNQVQHELYVRNGAFGSAGATTQEGDMVVNVDGDSYIRNVCQVGFAINVFSGRTFHPMFNALPNSAGSYGSNTVCGSPKRMYTFQYNDDTSGRRKARDFIRGIPNGDFIVVRYILRDVSPSANYAANWASDAAIQGAGNTFYDVLKNAGFTLIDSMNRKRVFAFVFQKGNSNFIPVQGLSAGGFDVMSLTALAPASDSTGSITSPLFGPAARWKTMQWSGSNLEPSRPDSVLVSVLGVRLNNTVDTLIRDIRPGQNSVDVSGIDASVYPYLKLRMVTSDTANYTPQQLDYWRIYYSPRAEGAVAPNLLFEMRDTFDVGEPINFRLAFKNVSEVGFDSLRVKAIVTDRNNVATVIQLGRFKPLPAGDTLNVRFPIDSRRLVGLNTLYVDVNPDNDQPELYHFNNFIYKNFYVRGDTLNPLLDVTFDNRHILNGDIVSARPSIDIRLKDEAKWRLLDDTSLVSLQVIDPDGVSHSYGFDNDTLRFEPATSGSNNQATVRFHPNFLLDGDYQLVVSGKDKSGNGAGRMEYKIGFQVINKPMISNMLNYPNPFTTSTAFVFTITGSEVPQNIRIQILTITGKVVREITKEELGPLHIGTNITEFKWDGTDQYGGKLANGVYLYRVITNLNGQSLEKFTNKAQGEKTDKYFNKGYGKMYLMR